MDQKFQTTLDQADELFDTAQNELARPEEDVVPYSVCRSAFKSVNKYLTGYLIKNGLEIHSSMSLEEMLKKCQEIDPKFNDLDLKLLYSTSEEENVWTDMKMVKEYIAMAEKTKKLVSN